jgi:hypothetical protein
VTPFASQFGGYNPLLQLLAQQSNPFGGFSGYNQAIPQIGNYGFNPYQPNPMAGLVPTPHPLAGLIPAINPLIAAQLAGINPAYLSSLAPQIWGGQLNPQTNPQLNPAFTNPLFQSAGNDAGYFGSSPFGTQLGQYGQQYGQYGGPLGWGNVGQSITPFNASINPLTTGPLATGVPMQPFLTPNFATQDPVAATLLAQQKLPIRPLISPQQVDPYQIGLSSLAGGTFGQTADPYSALMQGQLMPQHALNPLQQLSRGFTLANWGGSPYPLGQQSLLGQPGVPFNG